MYKIKMMALTLISALVLCSCGQSAQKSEVLLYQGNDKSEQNQQYETTKVKKGTYKEKISATGSIYYTDENAETIDDENAYLDKICVKNKQKVKKGDVIAVYHIKSSKASLQKQKLLLDQAKSQYESGLKAKKNEILAKEKSINTLTNDSEKRIARIELKRLQQEYRQMVNSGSDVRKQEKEYNELIRKQSKTNLKAAYSGTVVSPVSPSEYSDTPVTGETLMKIRDESEFLIQVEDADGTLRYNMSVDIGLGATSENIKYHIKGKVISTDNLTSTSAEDESTSVQLVRISKEDQKKYDYKKYNLFVSGVSLRIDNALMVSSDAVYEETQDNATKLYVLLVENSKLHKRYIVSNYKQDKFYLVNQGVEEGQTLAIMKQ